MPLNKETKLYVYIQTGLIKQDGFLIIFNSFFQVSK